MKAPLDPLIDEARGAFGADAHERVDWERVDAGLFAAITAEQQAERRRFAPDASRSRGWAPVVAVLAAAAAVLLAVGPRVHEAGVRAAAPASDDVAGAIAAIGDPASASAGAPTGQVLVDGKAVLPGATLRSRQVLEARGTAALVDRPGGLTLLVESGSRVRVARPQSPLVVVLEHGAVEADVARVARGEAFAVDVDGARIAVHGTHLRVARVDRHAVVDLTDGVVVVGAAPQSGAVVGALVTAPAHFEIDPASPSRPLHLTHDVGSVRTALDLGSLLGATQPHAALAPPGGARPDRGTEPELGASGPEVPSGIVPRPHEPMHASGGLLSGRTPASAVASPGPSPSSIGAPPAPSGTPSAGPEATEAPDAFVTRAVLACMAERPRADNVTILFRTTLRLEIGSDGTVREARFDPPVLPDVNECAAPSIFRARFPRPGSVALPIDFRN